jgi:hypothetical protein
MLTMLKDYKGKVEINDVSYDNIRDAIKRFNSVDDSIHIRLCAKRDNAIKTHSDAIQHKITVKQYMTRKATPEFDFMKQWNNDEPMPYRTMIGTIEKETRGMVYMKLHADITEEKTLHCLRCGRPITNPVSQYFGLGPECGGHNYVNPFYSKEELQEAVKAYREKLRNVTWEGWIIRSAITNDEEVTV